MDNKRRKPWLFSRFSVFLEAPSGLSMAEREGLGANSLRAELRKQRGQVRNLRPAPPESFNGLLYSAKANDGLLLLRGTSGVDSQLAHARLQRAVGVIYKPNSERLSHYSTATLTRRFNAQIYIARTRAVTPLD